MYWYQNSVFYSISYYSAGSLIITVCYHELFNNTAVVKVEYDVSGWFRIKSGVNAGDYNAGD